VQHIINIALHPGESNNVSAGVSGKLMARSASSFVSLGDAHESGKAVMFSRRWTEAGD
jgi:hypothetical protein